MDMQQELESCQEQIEAMNRSAAKDADRHEKTETKLRDTEKQLEQAMIVLRNVSASREGLLLKRPVGNLGVLEVSALTEKASALFYLVDQFLLYSPWEKSQTQEGG